MEIDMASIFDTADTQITHLESMEIDRMDLVRKYGFRDSGTIFPHYDLLIPIPHPTLGRIFETFATMWLGDDYKPRLLTYKTKLSDPIAKYRVDNPKLIDLLSAMKQMQLNGIDVKLNL